MSELFKTLIIYMLFFLRSICKLKPESSCVSISVILFPIIEYIWTDPFPKKPLKERMPNL